MNHLGSYTHFSGIISSGIERTQVISQLQDNQETKQLVSWCADASIALKQKNWSFFAKYNVKISNKDITENRLDAIFQYSKNKLDFYLQGTADFSQKIYQVNGGVQYQSKQTTIQGGFNYNNNTGMIVPNLNISYQF